jgi:hypothetical protein
MPTPKKKPIAKKNAPPAPGPKPQAPPQGLAPFTTDDAEKAYEHFLPLVQALEGDIPVRSGDVEIALTNVRRGVASVAPLADKLDKSLPDISVNDLLELPALALALVHADGRVPEAIGAGDIDATLARIGPLREAGLQYLEVVADLGLLPKDRVRAVRAGKGKLDKARDCVDIAGIFREYAAALANKHPFTDAQIDDLAKTGTWLVEAIQPKGAARPAAQRHPASQIRDRFWRLVDERHDKLRTAGVVLFGIKHVDEMVPPLQSRSVTRKAEEAAPTKEAATPKESAGAEEAKT